MKEKLIEKIIEHIFSSAEPTEPRISTDDFIGKYCLIRTYSAGVHAGTVVSRDGKEIVLSQARRIWKWEGASSLSELAMKGTAKPSECKFPCAVDTILLTEVIEIIPCTPAAQQSIVGVAEWKQH